METSSTRMRTFLREVVLDGKANRTIREQALDILLSRDGAFVNLKIFGTDTVIELGRADYISINTLLGESRRIEAIKVLRTNINFANTNFGLREAKNTIDNWDYSL